MSLGELEMYICQCSVSENHQKIFMKKLSPESCNRLTLPDSRILQARVLLLLTLSHEDHIIIIIISFSFLSLLMLRSDSSFIMKSDFCSSVYAEPE